MLVSVNPLCGEPPTGEPYAGEPHVRFGGRGDRATGLPYPYPFAAKRDANSFAGANHAKRTEYSIRNRLTPESRKGNRP
jgi:hypothetical protein